MPGTTTRTSDMEGAMVQDGISRTGTPYVIRYPKDGDAPSVHRYINRLSKERTFVRLQGEELTLEEEEEYVAKRICDNADKKTVTLFLEIGGEVQGICGLDRDSRTESHVARLHLSIDESVRGAGLGEIITTAVMDEAQKAMEGLRLLRLEVKEPNERARTLYGKLGFKEFGRLPNGTRHQGDLVDEIFMFKEI